ncbi:Ribonuclease P protein component [Mycoplasmopsis maculosa]|uniref:Ribonuclease P protein component n=1 Tax=Mycoplasmopsis maculosa TaxID=114885 RepID=A0A449B4Y5_9BACT|nr:ribonuclease P protein component [Mycoplasmopsis maculosa]VEU75635.1 Ribonuclease P protein component [Mycoplasmopsis maculosa]
MKKKYRLQKSWEFDEIIKQKKQLVNKYLVLYYKSSSDFKIGITIPKKFCNAYYRNFYKRQLKHIVHELNVYHLKFNMVLILRKEFLNEKFIIKADAIKKLFNKLSNK